MQDPFFGIIEIAGIYAQIREIRKGYDRFHIFSFFVSLLPDYTWF